MDIAFILVFIFFAIGSFVANYYSRRKNWPVAITVLVLQFAVLGVGLFRDWTQLLFTMGLGALCGGALGSIDLGGKLTQNKDEAPKRKGA